MRIATWNLDHVRPGHGERTEHLQRAMRKIPADVWVLTETHPAVAPGSDYRLVTNSGAADDRRDGECWVAIWVTPQLSVERLHPHGELDRSAAVLVDRPGRRPVVVAGTVLPWRKDGRRDPVRGGAAFCQSLRAQADDWRRLRGDPRSRELCVAGDLNLEVGHRLWTGTSAGRVALAEVLSQQGLSCVTGGANDPRARRGWGGSIDHVLVSSGLRVRPEDGIGIWPLEHPLPSTWPDHYGVWADLEDE